MEVIFLKLVNLSISASWLVLAILLLRPFLKKAPKWVNPILWCLVGVRLFLPVSIESSVSLIPNVEPISPTILYEQTFNADMPIINDKVEIDDIPSHFAEIEQYKNPLPNLISVVAKLWLVGCILFFLYAICSFLYIKNRVKTAIWIKDNIYQCEYIKTPFVLGVCRPCIYVPFSIEEKQLEHVIAHEKAHIKRRDHWMKPIAFFVLSIYWFHPLLWIAYVLLCRDIELACDERVIRQLNPQQRADYSEVLLFYSDSKYMRKLMMICPLAFGEVSVKERVRNVISYKKPAVWVIGIAILFCVTIGICFLTNPKTKKHLNVPYGILYEAAAPIYGFDETTTISIDRNSPFQFFIYNKKLYMRNDIMTSQKENFWIEIGQLQELEMKEKLFDRYFSYDDTKWTGFHSAKKLRENNEKIWRVIYDYKKYDEFLQLIDQKYYMYYIVLQKNGSVYLACGDFDYGEGGMEWDDSHFSLMVQCKECEDYKKQNVIECCKLAERNVIYKEERLKDVRHIKDKGHLRAIGHVYKSWLKELEEKMYEYMEM